jgi:hypothetical protein
MKSVALFAIALTALVLASNSALAAPVEKTDGFVCPVFNENSAVGMKNPNAVAIGEGHYTIPGPDVSVPLLATNGDGSGTPPGPHSEPGDTDYTAVWAG